MNRKRPAPDDLDPDYEDLSEQQQKKQKILQEDAKEATVRKIESIIHRQFSVEMSHKESELHLIDQRLHEARRMLDRLRACLVTCYYRNGKGGQRSSGDPTASIHPAVKCHLGKTVSALNAVSKQPPATEEKLSIVDPVTSDVGDGDEPKPKTSDVPAEKKITPTSEDLPVVKVKQKCENEATVRGGRYRKKKRIVVGNVSRYLPVDKREDKDEASHKWMVYVRGTREEPDLSHFVSAVCFFLHPSYRPHDLVKVTEPPFHLTRRGWGEFPVRVQLHFVDPRNKRVDIIHYLKLDRTYTGLQTLGAETVADVELEAPPLDRVAPSQTSSEQLEDSSQSSYLPHENEKCKLQIADSPIVEKSTRDVTATIEQVSHNVTTVTQATQDVTTRCHKVTHTLCGVDMVARPSHSVTTTTRTSYNDTVIAKLSHGVNTVVEPSHGVATVAQSSNDAVQPLCDATMEAKSLHGVTTTTTTTTEPGHTLTPDTQTLTDRITSAQPLSNPTTVPQPMLDMTTIAMHSYDTVAGLSKVLSKVAQPLQNVNTAAYVSHNTSTMIKPSHDITSLAQPSQNITTVVSFSNVNTVSELSPNAIKMTHSSSDISPLVNVITVSQSSNDVTRISSLSHNAVTVPPHTECNIQLVLQATPGLSRTSTSQAHSKLASSQLVHVTHDTRPGSDNKKRTVLIKMEPSGESLSGNVSTLSDANGQPLVQNKDGKKTSESYDPADIVGVKGDNRENTPPGDELQKQTELSRLGNEPGVLRDSCCNTNSGTVSTATMQKCVSTVLPSGCEFVSCIGGNGQRYLIPRHLLSKSPLEASALAASRARPCVGPRVGPGVGLNLRPSVYPMVGPRAGQNSGPRVGSSPGPETVLNLGPRVGASPGPGAVLNLGSNVGPRVGSDAVGLGFGARMGSATSGLSLVKPQGSVSLLRPFLLTDQLRQQRPLIDRSVHPTLTSPAPAKSRLLFANIANKAVILNIVNTSVCTTSSSTSFTEVLASPAVTNSNSTPADTLLVNRQPVRVEDHTTMESLVKAVVCLYPLCSSQITDRSLAPYCASSHKDFLQWNVGKRRAAEWQRACYVRRAISNLLRQQQQSKVTTLTSDEIWSTRCIMSWCRLHAYTPLDSGLVRSLTRGNRSKVRTHYDSYTDVSSLTNSLDVATEPASEDDDDDVDVVNDNVPKPPMRNSPKKEIGNEEPMSPEASFVHDLCRQIGVRLKPQPVVLPDGEVVHLSAVEYMLYGVMCAFTEDLLRHSHCSMMEHEQRSVEEITVENVYTTIESVDMFDFLSNRHLGVTDVAMDTLIQPANVKT